MLSKLSRKIIIGVFCVSVAGCASDLEKTVTQYKKVIYKYQSRLKASPQNLKLRMKLAQFFYEFKDYQSARDVLERIDATQAKILLAKAFARLKDYDRAIGIFEQIKENEKDSEYLYLYGEVLENKNLFPKALKIYEKVKGHFRSLAKQKMKEIKSKKEESIPAQINELYRQAENFLKEVKDEAAMIFIADEETEITSENTSISTAHVIEQVLQERGKELAEVEIGYDSTFERVELQFARTITADGKVVYAGKEGIRDVSRYLNFPLYSNAKVFIVSMPQVEVGAFIEYKIKIYSSKLVNEDNVSFIYRLREKYPVFKGAFRLTVPKNKEINFKIFNEAYAQTHKLAPFISEEAGKKVYTWNFNRITPLIPEYNMPPVPEVNPAVLISSFSSWDEIYKWWRTLYQDKLKLDEDIKKFIAALVKESITDLDKAKKIYEFCASNIRYVAVEYGDSGYEPHLAGDVFVNRYGDCKDQAILLTAMLKAAGMKAYPVLIPTRDVYPIDEQFPSINFNHAICAVNIDGKLVFMDPTAETTSFLDLPLDDQQRQVMVFLDEGWRIEETPQFKDNEIIYKMNISLDEEENAVIDREVTTKGFFSSAHRGYLKYTHPSKIKEDIQKRMVEISSFSRLIDYAIENIDGLDKSPILKYKFTTNKFLNPASSLRIIPQPAEIQIDPNIIGKEDREFPIDFGGIHAQRARINVGLFGNLAVKYMPDNIDLENKWFSFKSFYQLIPNEVKLTQDFIVKNRIIEQGEYKEFKKELEKVLYFLREEIILEKE